MESPRFKLTRAGAREARAYYGDVTAASPKKYRRRPRFDVVHTNSPKEARPMKEENEERSARRPRASRSLGRNLLSVPTLLLCGAAMPAVSHAAARFGTRCQSGLPER